ncbi:Fic family protein [Nitrosopumilus sp.]|uniref:Fic family protein n=1 Tax=Nitrosopumilus sp. TaxID=2024843 RepID=UPI00292E02EC|nr:Fic family protein [Nitrosopumilus sp.]
MVDKKYLIDLNKKILETYYKKHPGNHIPFVVRTEIDDILPMVEKVGRSGDERKNLIEKSSYLMASISWMQPFGDGNKRTALISAIKFLQDNGYDLEISSADDQREIRRLLYEIQDERTDMNILVVKQIIFYISKRISKHESR